uniref:Amidase domain-containing protein n=1 Tax=Ascaris lumbricoides TaxID=6252 RepID=A0A0M3I4S1_ASCLU
MAGSLFGAFTAGNVLIRSYGGKDRRAHEHLDSSPAIFSTFERISLVYNQIDFKAIEAEAMSGHGVSRRLWPSIGKSLKEETDLKMALPPRFPGLIPAYGAMPLPPMAPIIDIQLQGRGLLKGHQSLRRDLVSAEERGVRLIKLKTEEGCTMICISSSFIAM